MNLFEPMTISRKLMFDCCELKSASSCRWKTANMESYASFYDAAPTVLRYGPA